MSRTLLDRPAFNRTRLKVEKSIGSRVLEQSASKRTQVALRADKKYEHPLIRTRIGVLPSVFVSYVRAPEQTRERAFFIDLCTTIVAHG